MTSGAAERPLLCDSEDASDRIDVAPRTDDREPPIEDRGVSMDLCEIEASEALDARDVVSERSESATIAKSLWDASSDKEPNWSS